jgi:hypothetical protein
MSTTKPGKVALWTGRVLSALPVLMMLGGAIYSLIKPAAVREGFEKFGYPERFFMPIIITEIICVLLYVFPQTSVLGAILLTGYLGGAVATHVRIADPAFVMPIIIGVIVWLGLFLREPRLRSLIPLRR